MQESKYEMGRGDDEGKTSKVNGTEDVVDGRRGFECEVHEIHIENAAEVKFPTRSFEGKRCKRRESNSRSIKVSESARPFWLWILPACEKMAGKKDLIRTHLAVSFPIPPMITPPSSNSLLKSNTCAEPPVPPDICPLVP